MAIVKKGTLTVATGGAAQTLNLGFVPSYFRMLNKTKMAANGDDGTPTNGIIISEWYNDMPSPSAVNWITTSGVPTMTYMTTGGISALNQSGLGTEFVPTNMTTNTNIHLVTTIDGITREATAHVHTSSNNPITAADVNVTTVTFHNIQGMTQINGLSGLVVGYVSSTEFVVNIDTTNFSQYSAAQANSPIANVITGEPPSTTSGFQIFNTPLSNTSIIGLTLGAEVMVTTADVWEYVAYLDASFTSD